ncbi:hypothetical protein Ancab_024144 [Ancistrocladus abbreviatus]
MGMFGVLNNMCSSRKAAFYNRAFLFSRSLVPSPCSMEIVVVCSYRSTQGMKDRITICYVLFSFLSLLSVSGFLFMAVFKKSAIIDLWHERTTINLFAWLSSGLFEEILAGLYKATLFAML